LALEAEAALDIDGITGVGVVDDEGSLVGVLSRTDLLRAADAEPGETFRVPAIPVYELMTPGPVTVEHDSPLDDAARRMLKRRIHRVFVQDGNETVGVLSTRDVMRAV
ncbi:MAG: CBS domain-containing protein, partial [Actinobacteria bacterium]|nr:CBS domain-containing protein [Actinomycetota bacterium]NIS31619.1 CBS domain-containing protein [Actinomycetota bacterium]NIU66735.1 CBS domain-containing protein [Actinomycetota bacterium]NIW28535.1 CBS domain-containing protein [Actinomycetota bacterium]NIX21020.1 CBS domain-containing protein [Actinomycetota bacterium]